MRPSTLNPQLSTLRELTWDNPVLVKEFRTRMRGARAYWVLLVYVLLLTLVVGVSYVNWYTQTSATGITQQAASNTGRELFQVLFALQAGLVALITPAITAGALTIEREQQTYPMLAASRLRPQHLIGGKLLAAVAFVALLLTSSLPLVSLSFLLGGVSPAEVFGTYMSLTLSALVMGSIGIFCSASIRTTAAATVATYAAVLLLFFGTLAFGLSMGSDAPFRSVNAATSIYHAVDMEPFFGIHLPSWLIGVTINLLMGLLFANLAMTRLEYYEDRRPLAVRGLATALWTAFIWVLFGNFFGQSANIWSTNAREAGSFAVTLLGFSLGLLLLVLPIFTTGEWCPSDEWKATSDEDRQPSLVTHYSALVPRFLSGMLPHAMFRAELPAGGPLMLFWLAISCTVLTVGFLLKGKLALFPLEFLALGALSVVVLAALTALGNFLSVALRDRKAALVLTYLISAALCLLPFVGYMSWQASDRSGSPHFSWQFLYLTPFMAFMQSADTNTGSSFWTNTPPMLLGHTPFWLVTLAVYAALAALLLALTLSRVRAAEAGRQIADAADPQRATSTAEARSS